MTTSHSHSSRVVFTTLMTWLQCLVVRALRVQLIVCALISSLLLFWVMHELTHAFSQSLWCEFCFSFCWICCFKFMKQVSKSFCLRRLRALTHVSLRWCALVCLCVCDDSCACVFVTSWNSLSSSNALVLIYLCYASLLLARSISFLLFYRWFRHSRTRSTIFKNVFSIPLSIFRISRISSINRSTCASTLLILRHHFHRIAKII